MRSNFHTHTKRCLHASGTEEDYVLAAVNAGLSVLGFSDHGPFPDRETGLRMSYGELDEHLAELDRLKRKYDGRINLLKGLEIEYYPQSKGYYEFLLGEKGLDYLALGEHTFLDGKGELMNVAFLKSTEEVLVYADNLCRGMETGLFAFAAHPDIFFKNDLPIDSNIEKACRMIADCAAENNVILEYNANGFRREKRLYPDGLRYQYPHPFFWDAVKGTDIRAIVGSDCHAPEQVWDESVSFAVRSASDMGLKLTDRIF